MGNTPSEVWQRGPLTGVPAFLQPVAHAILQANEEVATILHNFPDALLWERPANAASPAYHLQHLSGVLDRLFTYARGEMLSDEQRDYLAEESVVRKDLTVAILQERFHWQVQQCIRQLSATDEATLLSARGIGREQLPTTVIGLLFHAAEHTMRHVGQLLVTVQVLKSKV